EHQPGGGEVESAGGHDAKDFRTVQGEVARGHGHAKSGDAGEAAGTGHVVEAGASVEVVAAAGTTADGGALTVAAVGKCVAADGDDQGTRVHRDLRGSMLGEVPARGDSKGKVGGGGTKVTR